MQEILFKIPDFLNVKKIKKLFYGFNLFGCVQTKGMATFKK
jgi:hypothetical protein